MAEQSGAAIQPIDDQLQAAVDEKVKQLIERGQETVMQHIQTMGGMMTQATTQSTGGVSPITIPKGMLDDDFAAMVGVFGQHPTMITIVLLLQVIRLYRTQQDTPAKVAVADGVQAQTSQG